MSEQSYPNSVGPKWIAFSIACAACLSLAPACKKQAEPEPTASETQKSDEAKSETTQADEKPSSSTTSEPSSTDENKKTASESESSFVPSRQHPRKVEAKPVASVQVSPDDPLKGKFTLEEATKGLTGTGKLIATIETDQGKLECELYEDKAPITVANFVGLARGLRPFKDPSGDWVKKPAYDGTVFHRIVKGFMIQGGDAKGTGSGNPGYVIPDEIWEDAYHDQRGLLCMANRGPNTNGMQFFIMDGAAPHLDGKYTIFGKCGPDSVIEAIASSEVVGDRAANPPKMKRVTVERK